MPAAETHSQHQTQSQHATPKDAPPRYDPESNPGYKAFKKASADFVADLQQLESVLRDFKPSADPRAVDKTSGYFDIANTMMGLRGYMQDLCRRISAGPGAGAGGYAEGYAPKTVPAEAPPPSDPGYDQPAHSSQSGQPPAGSPPAQSQSQHNKR